MTTARALVLSKPHTLVAQDFPLPQVNAADGLLRVEACGLCGTDLEQYTGAMSAGFAFIPGHEIIGVMPALLRALARVGCTLPSGVVYWS